MVIPTEDEVILEDKTIWTDWQWQEPDFPYELNHLTHYYFTRYVGCNVYLVNRLTGEKRWLYYKAYSEMRIVPVKNF